MVVFCDGDFWHGRNWRRLRRRLFERANSEYWTAKISANIRRDRRQTRELEARGWTVIRVWEGDVRSDASGVAERIHQVVSQRLGSGVDERNNFWSLSLVGKRGEILRGG